MCSSWGPWLSSSDQVKGVRTNERNKHWLAPAATSPHQSGLYWRQDCQTGFWSSCCSEFAFHYQHLPINTELSGLPTWLLIVDYQAGKWNKYRLGYFVSFWERSVARMADSSPAPGGWGSWGLGGSSGETWRTNLERSSQSSTRQQEQSSVSGTTGGRRTAYCAGNERSFHISRFISNI